MTATVTPDLPTIPGSPEVQQDVEIIAKCLPGRGAALGRIMGRAGVTHQVLADAVGVDRSAVTRWLSEERWPLPDRLRQVLTFLPLDRELVSTACGWLIGEDAIGDVFRRSGALRSLTVTKDELISLIQGEDDFDRVDIIFRTMWPAVVLAMSLRSAGIRGAECADYQAAKWFSVERDKHMAEARRRGQEGERSVSSVQADWSAGNLEAHVTPVDHTAVSATPVEPDLSVVVSVLQAKRSEQV